MLGLCTYNANASGVRWCSIRELQPTPLVLSCEWMFCLRSATLESRLLRDMCQARVDLAAQVGRRDDSVFTLLIFHSHSVKKQSSTTMAHPVFWLSKTFFYPIGNTSPISLLQHVSPEDDADILLLGCGDPRNILYTIHASGLDQSSGTQQTQIRNSSILTVFQ